MQYRLNSKTIETLPPGTHSDGNNLYLVVKERGARSYMLRYQWRGRPQKMGLGSARDVLLKDARDKAIDANRLLAKGINPRDAREEERYAKDSVLFFDFAEELRLEKEQGFKNRAHKAKWKRTVHIHAKPLHQKRIDLITTDDVLGVLKPIWLKIPIAAKDVRQQLETIFAAAKARNRRSAENPALGTVIRKAAEAIERRLLGQSSARERALLRAYLDIGWRPPARGLIMIASRVASLAR